jgi:hypothetical protein
MNRAIVIGISLLGSCALFAGSQENQSRSWSKTYSVLPSQTLNIQNRKFHVAEIRTEYAVQLAAGPCHADSTVQWHCTFDEPSDLFIRDRIRTS